MSQVMNAFKMPYQERESEEYVSFDPHRIDHQPKGRKEVYNHLFRVEESKSDGAAVLGYD